MHFIINNINQILIETEYDLHHLVYIILYLAYLIFVMLKGLKPRKPSYFTFFFMPLLMGYSVWKFYNGFESGIYIIELLVIGTYAILKGVYLGHKKIIENINGVYIYHHNWKYIQIWLLLFIFKFIIMFAFELTANLSIPIWHTLIYLLIFYVIRTITMVRLHPQLLFSLKFNPKR